jgi:hypothetical protein
LSVQLGHTLPSEKAILDSVSVLHKLEKIQELGVINPRRGGGGGGGGGAGGGGGGDGGGGSSGIGGGCVRRKIQCINIE